MDRRSFLAALPALAAGRPWLAPPRHPPRVLTVRGPVDPAELGTTLVKTGVDAGPLAEVDRKLITAAALCHRRTALRIHCHTGDGRAAMDIVSTLDEQGVSPAARGQPRPPARPAGDPRPRL